MATVQNAERWAPIRGFEGLYEVSDHGRVRSLPRAAEGRWGDLPVPGCILTTNSKPYRRVSLCGNGPRATKHVHRLVADAFLPLPRLQGEQPGG
jgi:hypothetical protein